MTTNLENRIYDRLKGLNGNQKEQILDYLESIPRRHNTKIYRRKAMRQIREAISKQS